MEHKQEMLDVEKNIGKILTIGTIFSAGVILFGIVLFFAKGPSGLSSDQLLHQGRFFIELKTFTPEAWLMSGLFLLILTPVLRVVVSIWSFYHEKDYIYTGITIVVLIILLISMVFGIQH